VVDTHMLQPTSEDPNALRDTILKCKRSPAIKDYGDAAVVFLISQVGDSATATSFLTELQNNASLEGMVYSSTERLDELRAKFQAENDDRQYTAWVSKPNLLRRLLQVRAGYLTLFMFGF
jgi:hypothetical protein